MLPTWAVLGPITSPGALGGLRHCMGHGGSAPKGGRENQLSNCTPATVALAWLTWAQEHRAPTTASAKPGHCQGVVHKMVGPMLGPFASPWPTLSTTFAKNSKPFVFGLGFGNSEPVLSFGVQSSRA